MEKPSYQRPPLEPHLEAEIEATPTEEGGRQNPLFSGYRAPHDFGKPDELNDACTNILTLSQLVPAKRA